MFGQKYRAISLQIQIPTESKDRSPRFPPSSPGFPGRVTDFERDGRSTSGGGSPTMRDGRTAKTPRHVGPTGKSTGQVWPVKTHDAEHPEGKRQRQMEQKTRLPSVARERKATRSGQVGRWVREDPDPKRSLDL